MQIGVRALRLLAARSPRAFVLLVPDAAELLRSVAKEEHRLSGSWVWKGLRGVRIGSGWAMEGLERSLEGRRKGWSWVWTTRRGIGIGSGWALEGLKSPEGLGQFGAVCRALEGLEV